jgi:hypothetical protein
MYSIGPRHIVVPAPKTNLEVNGTPEGTFAAGSTIDVQLTDGVNPVTPDAVTVVGDVVTIEAPDATVENSNASYTDSVASGGTLVLPDTTFDIYVNGVFNTTFNQPTLDTNTINITN